jgi:hypothetical protein
MRDLPIHGEWMRLDYCPAADASGRLGMPGWPGSAPGACMKAAQAESTKPRLVETGDRFTAFALPATAMETIVHEIGDLFFDRHGSNRRPLQLS